METSQEMSLKQWCERLPSCHRVNKDLKHIKETLSLLSSMIHCGDNFSEKSREMYYKAQDIMNGE